MESTLLTAVTARAEEKVLAALEAVAQAGLLLEAESEYYFAHDVIREVVEAGVGVARRQGLHRRVAEALEQQPGEREVERLAFAVPPLIELAQAENERLGKAQPAGQPLRHLAVTGETLVRQLRKRQQAVGDQRLQARGRLTGIRLP